MRNLGTRLLLTVCALICPVLAWAQGGVPASPIQFTGPTGRPLAGATVTVCTSAGAGFPCTPQASIFTNAGLTLASPNPVTTDGNGNLPVIFAAPGVYILSVTGSGITSTLITVTVAGTGGGDAVLNGNNAFTGQNQLKLFKLNNWRIVDGVKYPMTGAGLVSAWADCLGDSTCPGVDATSAFGQTLSIPSTITISGNGKQFKWAGTLSPTSSAACPLFDVTGASVDFGGLGASGTQTLFASNILATTGYTCTSLVRDNVGSGEKGTNYHGFRLDGHSEAGLSFALLELGKSTATTNNENNWTQVDSVAVANCGANASGIKPSSTTLDLSGSIYLNRIFSADNSQCKIPVDLSQPGLDQIILSNSRLVGSVHALVIGPNTAAAADRVAEINVHDNDLSVVGGSAIDVITVQNSQMVNIHDNWIEAGSLITTTINVGTAGTAVAVSTNIYGNRFVGNNQVTQHIAITNAQSLRIHENHFISYTGTAPVLNTSGIDIYGFMNNGYGSQGDLMASYTGCVFCSGNSNTSNPQFLLAQEWGLKGDVSGRDLLSFWVQGEANAHFRIRNNGIIFTGPGGGTALGTWISSMPAAGAVNIAGVTAFNNATLLLNGSTSGTLGLNAQSTTPSGTLLLPTPVGSGVATQVIASGTTTLTANAALAAVTSQAANTTVATGTATTDAIEWSFATAPTAGDNLCHVLAYVTAGNVNFVRTNPTAAAQNVSAIVLNWRVIR